MQWDSFAIRFIGCFKLAGVEIVIHFLTPYLVMISIDKQQMVTNG